MDFTTNYCGPYYSDGKIQASVEDGQSEPVNALDQACKTHDSEYAKARPLDDLARMDAEESADYKFYKTVIELAEHPIRGPAYGVAVLYLNQALRFFERMQTKGNPGVSDWFVDDVPFQEEYTRDNWSGKVVKNGGPKPLAELPLVNSGGKRVSGTVNTGVPGGAPVVATGNVPTTEIPRPKMEPVPTVNHPKEAAKEQQLRGVVKAAVKHAEATSGQTTGLYRPLRKKKIYHTDSLTRIHEKYNPPKTKQTKPKKKPKKKENKALKWLKSFGQNKVHVK